MGLSESSQGGVAGRAQTWDNSSMSEPALNIDELSTAERLQLLEQLWDSLSSTPGGVPLTDAQRQELDRRLDDLEREGAAGIPWNEVLQQIRKRAR